MLWFISFKIGDVLDFQFYWGLEEDLHQFFAEKFPEGRILMHGWVQIVGFEYDEEDIDFLFLVSDRKATMDALDRLQSMGKVVVYHTHIRKMKAS